MCSITSDRLPVADEQLLMSSPAESARRNWEFGEYVGRHVMHTSFALGLSRVVEAADWLAGRRRDTRKLISWRRLRQLKIHT